MSVQCLESVCDLIGDRWTGPGAQRGRDLAHWSGATPQHSGCGAVTHLLLVVWDGEEVGMNWGSAMERLVLFSLRMMNMNKTEIEKEREILGNKEKCVRY